MPSLVRAPDGRRLVVHDTGPRAGGTLVWHHGTPQTGALLAPVVEAAAARGLRVVCVARPSYGGSTPQPGRTIASGALDTAVVADALGLGTFATAGASSGGSYALACGAALGARVSAVVALAAVAPWDGSDEWFAGMHSDAALRAAARGRDARAHLVEEFDPATFTAGDWSALDGAWAGLGEDAGRAGRESPDGAVDDDVALVSPWGVDLDALTCPVLLVHGGADRVVPPSHGERLARAVRGARLWRRPDDGHVSVLAALPDTLDELVALPGA